MLRRSVLAGLVVSLGLIAGCGDDNGDKVSTTEAATPTATATEPPAAVSTPAPKLSKVAALATADDGLSGFLVAGPPSEADNVGDWAEIEGDEPTRLRDLGFVAGARVDLTARKGGVAGVATVEQFRTAGSATAEVAYYEKLQQTQPTFPVSGIPGAVGFVAKGGGQKGMNVVYAKGSSTFIIGTLVAKKGPSQADLIAAARSQYDAAP